MVQNRRIMVQTRPPRPWTVAVPQPRERERERESCLLKRETEHRDTFAMIFTLGFSLGIFDKTHPSLTLPKKKITRWRGGETTSSSGGSAPGVQRESVCWHGILFREPKPTGSHPRDPIGLCRPTDETTPRCFIQEGDRAAVAKTTLL